MAKRYGSWKRSHFCLAAVAGLYLANSFINLISAGEFFARGRSELGKAQFYRQEIGVQQDSKSSKILRLDDLAPLFEARDNSIDLAQIYFDGAKGFVNRAFTVMDLGLPFRE